MKKLVNGIIEDCTEEEILEYENLKTNETNNFNVSIENLRFKRNNLLAETDYLGLSDNTMSEAMTNYRQELRDITEGLTTVEDVEAVTFPTKP
tara:strand:- start:37 stop:315 length:279 start_codon:yes stop_codon:yes gene_type:complete